MKSKKSKVRNANSKRIEYVCRHFSFIIVDITSENFEMNDDSDVNVEGQSSIRMKFGSYSDSVCITI